MFPASRARLLCEVGSLRSRLTKCAVENQQALERVCLIRRDLTQDFEHRSSQINVCMLTNCLVACPGGSDMSCQVLRAVMSCQVSVKHQSSIKAQHISHIHGASTHRSHAMPAFAVTVQFSVKFCSQDCLQVVVCTFYV